MKVYEGQGPVLPQIKKKINKDGTGGNDFKKIMDEIGFQAEKKEGIHLHKNLEPVADGVHIIHGADKIQDPSKIVEKNMVLEELRQTLDIVDFYAAKLADSSFSIREMTPLISHLEERMENLRSMELTPDLPGKLRPIISDTVITVGTEIARFKRGDYL